MKRVLITGAAGFLGSHLCDKFIAEGYQVIGMDNLLTGSLSNIEHLFSAATVYLLSPRRKPFCTRTRRTRLYLTLRIASKPHRLPKNAYPNPKSRLVGYP
jgi:nucleoside-diphosphate-sugar epimerase